MTHVINVQAIMSEKITVACSKVIAWVDHSIARDRQDNVINRVPTHEQV